ncbi:Winged helix DNA-binding domain-containing protein [Paramicrobacterium humi]|uniref:Winged helix DNA-binding domain-containing protein n=1 Tax=Paramicrobacterium humi TaxID=640635 RepID=A0A1H4QAR9_9MICO|nr:winged helix DNA-binding domain-containing protein [Microbacterium humi]SEC16756.1 Winged helix DNA-binding domain-containing protein [Microbacterium humi]
MVLLTAARLRRARFASLGLSQPTAPTAEAVVGRLGAVQGQDLPGVLWSLASRTRSCTVADVRAEFTAGRLVRGWPMRGTLHVVRPVDLAAFTNLTSPRVIRSMAATDRRLGLTPAVIEGACESVLGGLAERGSLDRQALRGLIAESGVSTTPAQRVSHVVYHLAARGLICLGPFAGTTQLFVDARRWCGSAPSDSDREQEADLSRLLLAYISGHGPVSAADAARWFGLPITLIRSALASLDDRLMTVETPSGPQWMAASALSEEILIASEKPVPVRLLAGFDEYMLGYVDRGFAVPAGRLDEIVPGGNGMFRATITVSGTVAGIWTKQNSGRVIGLEPFRELSAAAMHGIVREARRYAAAWELPADPRISLRG